MKVLVGIDNQGLYHPALNLLSRLRIQGMELVLAHSVDVTFPVPMYGLAAEAAFGIDFAENLNEIGQEVLDKAADEACGFKLKSETVLLAGAPGPAMIDFADREGVDLIAIQTERKGALGQLFLGSVARSLAIGARQSILVSKGKVETSGPITAVFATDHSDYANRALQSLIDLKPQGIDRIHVVCAAYMNEYEAYIMQFDLSKLSGTAEEMVEKLLNAKNLEVINKLRAAGFEATGAVRPGTPDEAIKEAMADTKADLLIMGAQGHGFIHRVLIGSVSLHQVLAEPYPVLVLRPKTS